MSEYSKISDVDLHAYIDGELSADRVSLVGEAILSDPVLADKVTAFRSDKQKLTEAFRQFGTENIPAEWINAIRTHRHKSTTRWRKFASIAAIFFIIIVGTITYVELNPDSGGDIVSAALTARGSFPYNVADPLRTDRRHDAILSEIVSAKVRIPDMRSAGFKLVGFRHYGGTSTRPAVEILYRNDQDQLFTLYVRRSDGDVRFDQFERNGLRVCVWQDDVVAMAMIGNVSTALMQRLASLAYLGLTT